MNVNEFSNLVSSLTGDKIKFLKLENQTAKKWYEKTYKSFDGDFELNTVYGVVRNGIIDFEFNTGKNIDNILKSFISQYTSKVVRYGFENGEVVKLSKEQKLKEIIESNKDRIECGFFYTTLYGFGMWDFFNSKHTHDILDKKMSAFLSSKNIEYKNEYSDALWVFRYKFNLPIESINNLLIDFKNQNQ